MSKWQQKLLSGEYEGSTLKTSKSPPEPNNRVLADFVRLVRVIGACDHRKLLDDDIILAELDADDLRELQTIKRQERLTWAQLLAHRLTHSEEVKP